MKTYLKKFDTHSDYETFTESADFILPNVSVCVNEDDVHYNPYHDTTLKFTAEQANSTVKLNRVGTATTLANTVLQYSTDGGNNWIDYAFTKQGSAGYSGNTITLENVGDSVKFKGTNATLGDYVSTFHYHQFVMTGKIKATGDITSLFNGVGGDFAMPNYGCFSLFNKCTSLTTAPALPSNTLANYCYSDMFKGCTSLTTVPALSATTLGEYCCRYMFEGCTSLTEAPELPATTLANGCYYQMFKGCTSLTMAPTLPATTLQSQCYCFMFQGCSNLSYIKAMFTTTPSSTYNMNWVLGVKSTGTFVKNSAATWNVNGGNGIPNGWTVQTASA